MDNNNCNNSIEQSRNQYKLKLHQTITKYKKHANSLKDNRPTIKIISHEDKTVKK
jgi:hypothetical protein